jgi:hypothetical protein
LADGLLRVGDVVVLQGRRAFGLAEHVPVNPAAFKLTNFVKDFLELKLSDYKELLVSDIGG